MPLLLIPLLFGGGALIAGTGYAVDKAGEGANDLANASLKFAIMALVLWYVGKKTGLTSSILGMVK